MVVCTTKIKERLHKMKNKKEITLTHFSFSFISALKCKCLPCVSRVKVVQTTCWDWVGWTCLPTSQRSNEAKLSSTVLEILVKGSNKLRVDAKHAVKAKDPCASVVASGSAAGSTAAFRPYWYSGNSSSSRGIRSPSAVEPLLSLPLCEWEKWAETADCLLWMAT